MFLAQERRCFLRKAAKAHLENRARSFLQDRWRERTEIEHSLQADRRVAETLLYHYPSPKEAQTASSSSAVQDWDLVN